MAAAVGPGYEPPSLADLFEQAGVQVGSLLEQKDLLLAPLLDEDNFPIEDFELYLGLWNDLLTSSTAADSLAYVTPHAPDSFWITQPMLYNVMSAAGGMPAQLQSLTDLGGASHWVQVMITEMDGCIRRAKVGRFDETPPNLRSRIADLVDQLDEKVQRHKGDRLDNLTDQARETLESVKSAAGVAGEVKLSQHYDELARAELFQANLFRWLAIGMAVFGALATGAFVLGPELNWAWAKIGSTDYVHLMQRVLFVGAVIGVAGYLSRQAHHHRATANWARALSVQLQTFNAFIAPLRNDKLSDDLRRDFGARVFGDHPAMKGEPTVTPSAAAMEAAVGWAAKLAGNSK